jgi:hypothetical protein
VNLRGTTVVLATHDRETIQRVGRRVLTLDRGRLLSDVTLNGTDPPDLSLSAGNPAGQPPERPAAPASSAAREPLEAPGPLEAPEAPEPSAAPDPLAAPAASAEGRAPTRDEPAGPEGLP